MAKARFRKTKEDFICEVCGTLNLGNGFTNHCYYCLWSKHVDIWPGDRKNDCGGLMEPVGFLKKNGHWQVIHVCQKCRIKKNSKINPQDNWGTIIKISQKNNYILKTEG